MCLDFISTQTFQSKGADSVDGQLREDKECPFSGVTSFDRVMRKVPKSDARSVCVPLRSVLRMVVYDVVICA